MAVIIYQILYIRKFEVIEQKNRTNWQKQLKIMSVFLAKLEARIIIRCLSVEKI